MGMSKKLNFIRFYTILVVLAMCLPSVEDLVTRNSCDWICNAESGTIDWKELERKISQGELTKLEITYKQSVDPSCGSENDTLDLNNKTEDAALWFKMAPTSMGKIALLSSIISGEILTGRVFFKSDKAMNVSCRIFKPITRPTTNRSSLFAFDLPQSVMYFVKEKANCSERDDDFWILIRKEKQTHITLPGSSLETSPQVDASYDERKLTVSDTWLVVSVLIWIIIVLCSAAILLLFRPSEVTVQLTQTTRENSESARSPVQGDDIPDERLNQPIQDSQLPDDDADESCETNREYEIDVSPYGIIETLDGDRSTPIASQSEMVGAPQRTSNSNPFRKTDSERVIVVYPKTIHPSTSDDVEETRTSENSNSRCSNPRISPGEIAASSDTGCSSCPVSSGETAASSAPLASVESLTVDEQSSENDLRVESGVVINMPQSDHRSSFVEDQSVSHEGNGNCISMIVVGRSSPVSIGSWIGNKLFIASNGNQCHKLKMLVKFIIISFLPILLLTGFGDLLLILLNIDQEIALYLPNHHLTSSVFIEVFNAAHPGLMFLAVFSLVCYTVRSLFVYGNISECSNWKSCFVHSGHPFALSRLRCLFNPCDECKNSQSDCPKQIEVPDNIFHNLEELPGIFIKYWSCLFHCFVEYVEWMKIDLQVKIILILLVIAIMIILALFWRYALLVLSLIFLFLLVFTPLVDILLSSPLVCLCHGRMRAFKDERPRFKFFELFLTVFSLIWLTIYSVRGALVVEIASVAFVHMLIGHPKKVLVSVTVVALACHYVFSSYICLTAQYLGLVKELFNSYRKKFKELEEKGEVNNLFNFNQGEHKKLIPTELFQYACEHELIKKPVRNSVAIMLLKTLVPLLLSLFVYPLIHLPRSDSASIGTAVITLLGTYNYFNNRINKEPPKFNEEDIDIVVDDYITMKQ